MRIKIAARNIITWFAPFIRLTVGRQDIYYHMIEILSWWTLSSFRMASLGPLYIDRRSLLWPNSRHSKIWCVWLLSKHSHYRQRTFHLHIPRLSEGSTTCQHQHCLHTDQLFQAIRMDFLDPHESWSHLSICKSCNRNTSRIPCPLQWGTEKLTNYLWNKPRNYRTWTDKNELPSVTVAFISRAAHMK